MRYTYSTDDKRSFTYVAKQADSSIFDAPLVVFGCSDVYSFSGLVA